MADNGSEAGPTAGSTAGPTGPVQLLELTGVTKRFGGLPAVDDLSFAVREGEVLGIIGPNGAGKSTLIGLIGGAIAPTAGSVYFQGQNIGRRSPHARSQLGIARTFQVTQPFVGLDVRENVLVGALFGRHELSRTEALQVTEEVLERVGLARKARLRGDELTVADRKRLEVARALATNPKLLLLDEVMAGLTPNEVDQAVELIRAINRSGVTVLVVEHIMRAIRGVSDRVLVMHHGRKIAEDTPDAVLADPAVIEAYLGERYAKQRQSAQTVQSGQTSEAGQDPDRGSDPETAETQANEWKEGLA